LDAEMVRRRARSPDELCRSAAGLVCSLAVTPLDISASAVRALLAAGREPRWLVPDALYGTPELLEPYRPPRAGRAG
jgi:nicotinate-nucleotide adenylyltransferase